MTITLERPRAAAHYWPGDIPGITTGLVLACPGRFEALRQRPVANTSGGNLDKLLGALGALLPAAFPSSRRYDYVISNSVKTVYWDGMPDPSKPGGVNRVTVPDLSEVEEQDNIDRLFQEVGHLAVILALGDQAHHALRLMRQQGFRGRVLFGKHPSFPSINTRIREDVDGNPILKGQKDATARRMAVVAREILAAS